MSSSDSSRPLRLLVACADCKAQHDATGLAAGSRLHCACGAEMVVPKTQAHDAAVVRCRSCGGPRLGDVAACTFCGADFVLHEQDLHTVCAGCMARISDRARFCHGCGTAVAPVGGMAEASSKACPACGGARLLVSRSLGDAGVTVLECPSCAGLWLGVEAFRLLESGARSGATSWRPGKAAPSTAAEAAAQAVAYRRCCECGTLMNRQNYGRKSGVVIDTCAEHGLWFDRDELARILAWVRDGGLTRAESLAREEAATVQRGARPAVMGPLLDDRPMGWAPRRSLLDIGVDLLVHAFDRLSTR